MTNTLLLMKHQIFKTLIPVDLFTSFLSDVCRCEGSEYIVDKSAHKRSKLFIDEDTFLYKLKEYYHESKHKYVVNVVTYKGFLTVMRQIARSLKLSYISRLKYDKSKYEIILNIFTPLPLVS